MKLGYYPGCSLHATARELDESFRAIAPLLGLELEEIRDWSCCGATSAHATNHRLALGLSARNLSLAEEQGFERLASPCAACFSRLATARLELQKGGPDVDAVRAALSRPVTGQVEVLNLPAILQELLPAIREKAGSAVSGMKVACYYGCLLVRPPEIARFDDAEAPRSMEEIAQAAGAVPVSWNRKLDCCGGGFSIARTGSVVRLGRAILEDARAAGAEAVLVACPMCHSNLDLRQKAMAARGERLSMPILYLSQLVGLALGLPPKQLGLTRHFVSTAPVTQRALALPQKA